MLGACNYKHTAKADAPYFFVSCHIYKNHKSTETIVMTKAN